MQLKIQNILKDKDKLQSESFSKAYLQNTIK